MTQQQCSSSLSFSSSCSETSPLAPSIHEQLGELKLVYFHIWGLPRGSVVKNPLAMQETRVLSQGWEDSLGEEMATHSGILAWEIPSAEEPGGLQSMGSQKNRTQFSD